MLSDRATLYRSILRELRQSVSMTPISSLFKLTFSQIAPPRRVNRNIMAQFRSIAENVDSQSDTQVKQELEKAANFLRAQREHKVCVVGLQMRRGVDELVQILLERYNPLFDLTAKERIEATARRVGLNMPKLHTDSSPS